MKKSELRQIIREEINGVLLELKGDKWGKYKKKKYPKVYNLWGSLKNIPKIKRGTHPKEIFEYYTNQIEKAGYKVDVDTNQSWLDRLMKQKTTGYFSTKGKDPRISVKIPNSSTRINLDMVAFISEDDSVDPLDDKKLKDRSWNDFEYKFYVAGKRNVFGVLDVHNK